MALVREHAAAYGAEAFDALGYGGEAFDAAALFGGYATSPEPPATASFNNGGGNSSVWAGGAGSVLAFDRAAGSGDEEECDAWIEAMDYGAVAAAPARPSVGFDATTGCFTLTERASASSSGGAGRGFGLLFPSTSGGASPDRIAALARASQKRAYVVNSAESRQAVSPNKKQCGAGRKTSKPKSAPAVPTKDPQSLAAKTRRERISERLRTLQELVPNGTKVDLVTMLEKAISYVKFLQLQVKVLATDEFWPAQGGKAPAISQVREALDAILSSSHKGQLTN
ncbi:hypothetical protein PR202_gb09534 [Eleusine coracana subsp. coracana]|uniref:BHLH domain-containing protein n=1 Tax=Eleusine coracana subsp. coracana TaxID=191504 RepID=A0AAV5EH12_ELECO|nr:hypothetical protein QOZ80_2BG0198370 [Eleusine coracana subsp. coracana]GJN22008.1 hypothetical protein PR202_gb09534 [Eleusine coracana subsp. coracana]